MPEAQKTFIINFSHQKNFSLQLHAVHCFWLCAQHNIGFVLIPAMSQYYMPCIPCSSHMILVSSIWDVWLNSWIPPSNSTVQGSSTGIKPEGHRHKDEFQKWKL